MAEETMSGRLFLHFEQGYEGPSWAFQDEKYILKDELMPGGERWDYAGLHMLGLGDHLKVTGPSGITLFNSGLLLGGISKSPMPFWYPKGITKSKWTKLFNEPAKGGIALKAELTPAVSDRVRMAVGRVMSGDFLVHIESFEDWTIREGMSSRLFTYVITVAKYFPGRRKKPNRFQLYFIPRQSRCGCTYKKAKHVCICNRLPEDVLSSIKPL